MSTKHRRDGREMWLVDAERKENRTSKRRASDGGIVNRKQTQQRQAQDNKLRGSAAHESSIVRSRASRSGFRAVEGPRISRDQKLQKVTEGKRNMSVTCSNNVLLFVESPFVPCLLVLAVACFACLLAVCARALCYNRTLGSALACVEEKLDSLHVLVQCNIPTHDVQKDCMTCIESTLYERCLESLCV
jgi:hypothetical protein